MKKLKKIISLTVVSVMIFIFSSCSALVSAFENKDLRTYTDQMLNSILTNDNKTAYALVSDVCSEGDFKRVFDDMHNLLKDVGTYELKLVSINQKNNYEKGENVTTLDSVYEMKTDKARYVVSVQSSSQNAKLSAFFITPYEKTSLYYTGVIENMKGASFAQWAMLLSNLLILTLIIVALIDCCRQKVKVKALWIILIIIGVLALGLTISSSGINFNFYLTWITSYNAIVRYGSGEVTARFIIPWGALLYFILRRSLIKKPEIEQQIEPEMIITEE